LKFAWFDRLQDLPRNQFTIYLAHEFFDALPVFLFKHTDAGWREIMVDIDEEHELNFRKALAVERTKSLLLLEYQIHLKNRDLDSVIQISPDTIDITSEIARRINLSGGFGLFADYGSEIVNSDRIRGIKNHKWISPFSSPGKVDLSSDVEFSSLKIAAEKQGWILTNLEVVFHGPKTQRDFLLGLGMGYRVKMLLQAAKNEKQKMDLLHSAERLVSPDQMGKAYKICVLTQKGYIPFGFE
jgi:NADH dehydrogenase [ubiquinone] 1 alpha subcomplex assembly factor 7